MKTGTLKNVILTILTCVTVALVLTCASRDGDTFTQSNPFDPGGDNFQINQKPQSLTISADSCKWYDFNHTTRKGIIKITYRAYDPNGKYDTLTYTIYAGNSQTSLDSIYSGTDTVFYIPSLSLAQTVYLKITVKDRFDSSLTDNLVFPTPSGVPPKAPRIIYYSASTSYMYIQLKIDTVFNVSGYRIYRSESVDGNYIRLKDTVPYIPYSNNYFYYMDYARDYNTHYYIASTYNSYGECRAQIPAEARIPYDNISTPSISSVSKGYYCDSIEITWYPTTSSYVSYYKLFRKESFSGTNKAIATIPKPSSTSLFYYYDSSYTGDTCYYTLVAFDSQNRGSYPSSAVYGYFQRIAYPYPFNATLGAYLTHIQLTWSTVTGAQGYKIYRSTSYNGIYDLLTTTSANSYNDSVTTSAYYYYKISSYDNKEREGAKSGYIYGYVRQLSAPSSFTASDGLYADRILLSWNSVAGAAKYYIFRNTTSGGAYTRIDSTTATSYNDYSITGTSYFYYMAAAVDSVGRMGPYSGYDYGYLRAFSYPANFLVSKYMHKNRVALTWDKEPKAGSYTIYRSLYTSGPFTLLSSATDVSFNDTSALQNTTYYYKISSVDNATESALSPYQFGCFLVYPQSFTATAYSGYIQLYWSTNSNLSGYAIYRSDNDTSFQKIATIGNNTISYYRDSVATFNVYYYKIAGLSTVDESYWSPTSSAQRIPLPPDSLSGEDAVNCVKLSWKPAEGAKNYYVYRGTSSTSTTLLDSTAVTSYTDSLFISTRFYYQVASKNLGGISTKSSYVQAGAITTPLAPYSFSVTNHPVCIVLGWYQNTSGSPASVFYIYRSTSSTGAYTKIDSTTQLSYNDSVTNAATYYYMVSGRNSVGEGPKTAYKYGNRIAPYIPANVTAGNELYVTHIPANWSRSVGAEGYYIYRSTSATGTYSKIGATIDTFYNDSSAALSIIYYYKVSAYSFIGESVQGSYAAGKLLSPPQPPSIVIATQGTKTDTITVTWAASDKAEEYAVYRDIDTNFTNPVFRGKTTALLFNDTTKSDTLLLYRVKAINKAGESVLSASYGTGYIKPTKIPGMPRDLKADSSSTYIGLSWNTPYTGSPVTTYTIYRSDSSGGSFQQVDTTSTLTYKDYVPLTWPTYYWYRITAKNSIGEGAVSITVKGTRK